MALSSVFKKAAVMAVRTFSGELGPCTYRSLQSDPVQPPYDPETGVITPVYNDYSLLIAFDSISDNAPYPQKFINEHKIALIPGDSLPERPKKGDVIIDTDGDQLLIDTAAVERDQYNALYTVFVLKQNSGVM